MSQHDGHVHARRRHFDRIFSRRFTSACREDRADVVGIAREAFSAHGIVPARSRSFSFARLREDGGRASAYAFTVTWTRGQLTLSGDVGNLTVTHWQALADLKEGMEWLAGCEYSYLMSKTGCAMEYDPEATLRDVVRFANEEALYEVRATTMEARQHRAYAATELARLARERREWRESHRLSHSSRRRKGDDRLRPARPRHADYVPERDEWAGPPRLRFKDDSRFSSLLRTGNDREVEGLPDGMRTWFRIWRVVEGQWGGDVSDILTAKGRGRLKEAMRRRLGDEHSAIDFVREAGLQDYGLSRRYSGQSVYQFEALAFAAKAIAATLEAEGTVVSLVR